MKPTSPRRVGRGDNGRRGPVAERPAALGEVLRGAMRGWRETVAALAGSVRLHSPAAWVSRRRGDLALLAERAARQSAARRAGGRRAVRGPWGKLGRLHR